MAASAEPYTVKPGDSLWKIAHHSLGHGAMWPIIYVLNQRREFQTPGSRRLVDPDKIYSGQVLYLPTRIDPAMLKRAPGQRAIPGPIRQTEQADQQGGAVAQAAPRSGPPAPQQAGVPYAPRETNGAGGPANGKAGATLLNDFNIRFDTSKTLLKRKVGQFEIEIQFKGWVSLRHDRVIQATTFSNKAIEDQRRFELGHTLGNLIATRKVKIEWQTGKIEYECLLTAHMANGKPAPISTGFVLDKSVPPLAWRTKIDLGSGQGHWRDIIYSTDNLSITITVRWKPDAKNPKPPPGTGVISLVPAVAILAATAQPVTPPAPGQAQPVPVPQSPPVTAPLPAPAPAPPQVAPSPAPVPQAAPRSANAPASTQDTGDHEGEGWLARQWHWVEHHPVEVTEAVVVAVVVVAAAPAVIAAVTAVTAAELTTAAAAGVIVAGGAAMHRASPGPGV